MAPYGSETPIALIPTAAVGMGKTCSRLYMVLTGRKELNCEVRSSMAVAALQDAVVGVRDEEQ